MQKIKTQKYKLIKIPKGFGLIEGLVAIIIFSIGLVGVIKLMQTSSKSKQNFESHIMATSIASQTIERLMALSSLENPWAIEGFITKTCSNPAYAAVCQIGVKSRTDFESQIQNAGELKNLTQSPTQLPTFAHATNKGQTITNKCNDIIYVTVKYKQENLNNKSNAVVNQTKSIEVYQYFIDNITKNKLGLPCSV